jgi:hypothetical protein
MDMLVGPEWTRDAACKDLEPSRPTLCSFLSEAEKAMLGVLYVEGAPRPSSVWSRPYPKARFSGFWGGARSGSAES